MVWTEEFNTVNRAKLAWRETVYTTGTHTGQEDVQQMARNVHDVTMQTLLRTYTEARAYRPPYITLDEELFMIHTKTIKKQVGTLEFDVAR